MSDRRLLILSNAHLDCNTGLHICSIGKELSARGYDVRVAVPTEEDVNRSSKVTSLKILASESYPSRRPEWLPHTIWMWTPREANRRALERLTSLVDAPYYVHFEDNEFEITRSAYGLSPAILREWADGSPPPQATTVPDHLSDPSRLGGLVARSSGVTGLVDELVNQQICAGKRSIVFWPGYDESLAWKQPADQQIREAYGVPKGNFVVVYTGNLHAANVREIRSLYLAVALLNRDGLGVTLVRTGDDYVDLSEMGTDLLTENVISLGMIERTRLPGLLSIADILVQPGLPDQFNIFRFPSKLPEFLASGKPVVLPQCNLGKHLTNMKNAVVLPRCSAQEIAAALARLLPDSVLLKQIGEAGAEFASEHLRWGVAAAKVDEFLSH